MSTLPRVVRDSSPSHPPDFPPQLVGRCVRITWMRRTPLDELQWPTYRVLDVYGTWVRLVGIDDPLRVDWRTPHDMPWWAQVMEIAAIEELPEVEE